MSPDIEKRFVINGQEYRFTAMWWWEDDRDRWVVDYKLEEKRGDSGIDVALYGTWKKVTHGLDRHVNSAEDVEAKVERAYEQTRKIAEKRETEPPEIDPDI